MKTSGTFGEFVPAPGFPIRKRPLKEAYQWRFEFPNGYGASVINGEGAYGHEGAEFEIAPTKNGELVGYDLFPEWGDDVFGHQNEAQIVEWLTRIEAL